MLVLSLSKYPVEENAFLNKTWYRTRFLWWVLLFDFSIIKRITKLRVFIGLLRIELCLSLLIPEKARELFCTWLGYSKQTGLVRVWFRFLISFLTFLLLKRHLFIQFALLKDFEGNLFSSQIFYAVINTHADLYFSSISCN